LYVVIWTSHYEMARSVTHHGTSMCHPFHRVWPNTPFL